jgi:hypothetical protein
MSRERTTTAAILECGEQDVAALVGALGGELGFTYCSRPRVTHLPSGTLMFEFEIDLGTPTDHYIRRFTFHVLMPGDKGEEKKEGSNV